nr:MAG TPA: hypothetical protein [Caudoviricetes sp.]
MKTTDLKRNILSKAILTAYVSNEINTQADVDVIMGKIEKDLNVSKQEAASFFRESIGIN